MGNIEIDVVVVMLCHLRHTLLIIMSLVFVIIGS